MLCTISVNATLYSGKLTNACTIFFKPWALRREGAKADRKTKNAYGQTRKILENETEKMSIPS